MAIFRAELRAQRKDEFILLEQMQNSHSHTKCSYAQYTHQSVRKMEKY